MDVHGRGQVGRIAFLLGLDRGKNDFRKVSRVIMFSRR